MKLSDIQHGEELTPQQIADLTEYLIDLSNDDMKTINSLYAHKGNTHDDIKYITPLAVFKNPKGAKYRVILKSTSTNLMGIDKFDGDKWHTIHNYTRFRDGKIADAYRGFKDRLLMVIEAYIWIVHILNFEDTLTPIYISEETKKIRK